MSNDDTKPPASDVVFLHGPSEDGKGVRVLRQRDDTLEVGELRAMEEGRPLRGDVVRLKPRAEHERLFDVEVVHAHQDDKAREARSDRGGPAQVASDAYRAGWDAIFGAHTPTDRPN